MQQLTVSKIINLIKHNKTFEAIASDHSFIIKINKYVPYCCTAIHNGSDLRDSLKEKIALNDYNRWYEEDPHTGSFIDTLPITLIGLDSRFEYDLNRKPEHCIYDEAWGKKVWKDPLTPDEKKESLKKHHNFYKVLHTLIQELEKLYTACVVYDIHSYNHQRWNRFVPLFNIGTERVDNKRFGATIKHWKKTLSNIPITGVENETKINQVFFGRGYNLEFITQNFANTLVLATEVKKVYCNELTGEEYPKIIQELQHQFKQAILDNAYLFSQQHTTWVSKNNIHLLDKKIDPALSSIDKNLYRILKNFELLVHVNPINAEVEQKKFIKNKYTELPQFKYAPVKINPFELKRQLSSLKTRDISDISIRHLYEAVINSYFDKIDLLSTLNTKNFLYNSLRYFGRPSRKDLVYAQYILHLPPIPKEPKNPALLTIEEALTIFKEGIKQYNLNWKLQLSKKTIADIMVVSSKKTVLINPHAEFTKREIKALVEHEIGVHAVTTQNALDEKLKIFYLGLPRNTMTQEGLAILAEYLSGGITLKRLKEIALRVVVADMMCNSANFIECFKHLINRYEMDIPDAYALVTRIFRGGGFTKDYLYLSGFKEVLKRWKANVNLTPLFVGKTSLAFYDTIHEMMERELVIRPRYMTNSLQHPKKYKNNEIYEYIISGLN